jgi:hypothetical protein
VEEEENWLHEPQSSTKTDIKTDQNFKFLLTRGHYYVQKCMPMDAKFNPLYKIVLYISNIHCNIAPIYT